MSYSTTTSALQGRKTKTNLETGHAITEGDTVTVGKGTNVWDVTQVFSNNGRPEVELHRQSKGKVTYRRYSMDILTVVESIIKADEEYTASKAEEAKAQHPANTSKVETAEELAALPSGASRKVGHHTYTKNWSGAWWRTGMMLSSDELARQMAAQPKQWVVRDTNTGTNLADRTYSTQEEAQKFADSYNRYDETEPYTVAYVPTDEEVAEAVADMKAEILADIAKGVQPADVDDFSTLHDYVDANEYAGFCDDTKRGHWDVGTLCWVQEEVHKWLTTREIIEDECYVCGKHITEADEDRGTVFMDEGNGPGVDVCSDECGEAFYNLPEDEWVKFPTVSE